jgi:general nucleoside transport system permease protein
VLKLKRGVSEVISTIMLNFLAVFLLAYLVRGPMRDPQSIDEVSAPLPGWTRLARFSRSLGVGEVGGGSITLPDGRPLVAVGLDAGYLHAGVLVAALTVFLVWLWLARTGTGFRISAVGLNPAAAAAAGIPVPRTLLVAFLVSGALAGLAGGIEQLSAVSRLHRYAAGDPGYGFSGIAVALLGGLHPLGTLAAALFFGALRAGCDQMQRSAGISHHIAYVIQASLVLLLIAVKRSKLLK